MATVFDNAFPSSVFDVAFPETATTVATYPLPSQVLAGIEYGPNGDDYVGTATGGAGTVRYTHRPLGKTIPLYVGETSTVTIEIVDNEDAAIDCSDMTLEIIFESGASEITIADADITKTTTGCSFAATTALTLAERMWTYAIRQTGDGTVLRRGYLEVSYAANN